MAKAKKIKKTVPVTAVDELASQLADRITLTRVAETRNNKTRKQDYQTANSELLRHATILLMIAALIGIALGVAMFALEGGQEGVPAFGGVFEAQIPEQSARIIFLLDVLYPIFFGAGFAVLATSLQSRGNRPLVRLIMTSVLVVVTADFFENALVYNTLTGDEPYLLRWPLTVIKYAGLAFGGVMLSAIIPVWGGLGWVVHFLLRYAFPIAIAVLISGLGGLVAANIVGAIFPISLVLLALYSRQLSRA